MDSLALQVVPNPHGLYPLSKYISLLGTPGLTGFVGFNGLVEAEQVSCQLHVIVLNSWSLLLGRYNLYFIWGIGCWKVYI